MPTSIDRLPPASPGGQPQPRTRKTGPGTAAQWHRRVAYLALEAPREGHAAFTHVSEIVDGLRREGWAVDLLAAGHGKTLRRPGAVMRLLHYVPVQARLLMRLRGYDIVYIRAHPFALPAALSARLACLPVVHEVNGTYADLYVAHRWLRPLRPLCDWMQRWQYRHAVSLVTVTGGLADWLRNEVGAAGVEVATISNAANTDLFRPGARTDMTLPERYAVFVGGLTAWHGVPSMLAAVATPDWPEDLSLVIVGEGPEAGRVRTAAASDPRIVQLGRQPYREVAGIVAGARMGIVPISDPDGRSSAGGVAPIKLFETLACGVPVIVTEITGQAEFVRKHDCGMVVGVNDARGLARAAARLAAHPNEAAAMGSRGAELVRVRHSWTHRSEATSALLEGILEGGRKTASLRV